MFCNRKRRNEPCRDLNNDNLEEFLGKCRTTSGGGWECFYCNRPVKAKRSNLKAHLQSHIEEAPKRSCPLCRKPFHIKGSIKRHLKKCRRQPCTRQAAKTFSFFRGIAAVIGLYHRITRSTSSSVNGQVSSMALQRAPTGHALPLPIALPTIRNGAINSSNVVPPGIQWLENWVPPYMGLSRSADMTTNNDITFHAPNYYTTYNLPIVSPGFIGSSTYRGGMDLWGNPTVKMNSYMQSSSRDLEFDAYHHAPILPNTHIIQQLSTPLTAGVGISRNMHPSVHVGTQHRIDTAQAFSDAPHLTIGHQDLSTLAVEDTSVSFGYAHVPSDSTLFVPAMILQEGPAQQHSRDSTLHKSPNNK